jgi:hypothetical protein
LQAELRGEVKDLKDQHQVIAQGIQQLLQLHGVGQALDPDNLNPKAQVTQTLFKFCQKAITLQPPLTLHVICYLRLYSSNRQWALSQPSALVANFNANFLCCCLFSC